MEQMEQFSAAGLIKGILEKTLKGRMVPESKDTTP